MSGQSAAVRLEATDDIEDTQDVYMLWRSWMCLLLLLLGVRASLYSLMVPSADLRGMESMLY